MTTKGSSTKWSEFRRSKVPDEEAAQVTRAALDVALALDELRKSRGVTQVDVAKAMEIGQGGVSLLERRRDLFLSTLRDYIEALGGELEVAAVFGDDVRIPLAIGGARK